MSKQSIPTDQNGRAIPTLELAGATTKIAVASATARVVTPTGAASGDIVRVAADTNCYIKWGDSTVTATTSDALFPAGVEIMQIPRGATYLAAIRSTADGTLTITELV